MLRVTGDSPYWNCPVCGNGRTRENMITMPGEPDARTDSRSDGQGAVTGNRRPEEPYTGRSEDEEPDDNPTGPAHITDYQPRCWKCGRVLGKYFSRPWSIKCRRCKATNQGVLKEA